MKIQAVWDKQHYSGTIHKATAEAWTSSYMVYIAIPSCNMV